MIILDADAPELHVFPDGQRYTIDRWIRIDSGDVTELLGSGYYFSPIERLSVIDAARLIHAINQPRCNHAGGWLDEQLAELEL